MGYNPMVAVEVSIEILNHIARLAPRAAQQLRRRWLPRLPRLTWTEDNLLRQVVYEGLREDKPAAEVRRPAPHRQAGSPD